MNAAQAIEFRRPARTSPTLESFLSDFRKSVRSVTEDIVMYKKKEKAVEFLSAKLTCTNGI
jgi:histidine ammonia-lyase